ncbi:MAG: asparaginase [Clostridiales bacterium]|nr:asparaginase [Clostridiales bacterium]
MSRILVVTLGGTICSAVEKGDTIKLRTAPDKKIFEAFKKKNELSYLTPILYSSENADEEYFRKALSAIADECEKDKPDGILILHGTDSAAFFAQLAVRVLSYLDIPVLITGSKLPVSDPHSDAVRNVSYAMGLLGAACEGKLGAVTFGIVYTDEMMEDTVFVPAARVTDANFDGDYGKFPGKPSVRTLNKKEVQQYFSSPVKKILTVPCVPGYPFAEVDPAKYDKVLIETYHSGTQTVRGLTEFIGKAREAGVRCYMGPVHQGKVLYESTRELIKAGAVPMYDMPFEGCWAEAVVN